MRFMRKQKIPMIFFILSIALPCILACSGGGGSNGSQSVDDNTSSSQGEDYIISGKVQKGPYILWSNITIQELNNKLEPKGNVFLTYTINDKGQFNLETKIKSRFVEIIGNGYYFDEISGDLSASTLSLRTISDLEEGSNINVNILTTLTCDRIKTLIEEGLSFSDAVLDARLELLNEFNIPDLTDDYDTVSFDRLDIASSGDGNAVLLAISCILQQVATNRASSYSTVTSELSEFLPRMAIDFGEDGTIDDEELKDDIKTAGMTVNLTNVRSNLEERYSDLGETIDAPTFEDYIDSDGDSVINGNEDDTPDSFSFGDISEAESNTFQFSNEIAISGILDHGYASVSINAFYLNENDPLEDLDEDEMWIQSEGIIIKNGSELEGNSTEVVNGDTLQIKLRSRAGFGGVIKADLTVGTQTQSFSVTTRTPKLVYVQGYGQEDRIALEQGSIYFAIPIYPTESINAKYLGVGINEVWNNPQCESFSIYTDNGDEPGTAIFTSNGVFSSLFGTSENFEDLEGNTFDGHPRTQANLGHNGIDLSANTKYWVVVKFDGTKLPELLGSIDDVPFSERKQSNDGNNWTTSEGNVAASKTIRVFLSN